MASDNEEFDLFAVEGVPSVPVVTTIATTPLGVAAPRRQPKRTRRLAPLRTVVLLSAGVLLALVLVRAALRFHSEYNLLAEVRREGAEYWRTVCSEGRTRPPNSYDQCTRAKTAAHQFTRCTPIAARPSATPHTVSWPSNAFCTWRCATSTRLPNACPARRALSCG